MCNGIAVLVWTENGRLKGLCNGETSHDILCQKNEQLRLGKIEPYRFELLYPCNLVYDRGHNKLPLGEGLFGEQPPTEVWNVALSHAKPYFMKHEKKQLQFANLCRMKLEKADLSGADLRLADLRWADLRLADLSGADLREADLNVADLREADLNGADLRMANLKDIIKNEFTKGLE